ncbi:MAG: hypothetical protein DHS20C15_22370 [Planctomycetota bacterium]|nr:MAG: hypothetical protein DHS20C15_22370 [Planctomycetota bacterium]
MTSPELRHRRALCLAKLGDTRFLGHLDFQRLLERALRRSRLPVWSTQGFNPRFKLVFAEALPLGMASEGEWITFFLNEDLSPEAIREALEPALPQGVQLVAVSRGSPPTTCAPVLFELELRSGPPGERSAADALTELLSRDEYFVEDSRKRGRINIRPALIAGEVSAGHLRVELVANEGRPPRPGPLLEALRCLAREAGQPIPEFGLPLKRFDEQRRPGDDPWLDAAAATTATTATARNSSSTLASPKKVG